MNIDDTKYQILILGGTGAMGTSLVDILNKQGMSHIVVTSRQLRKDFGNVEYRQGDAHDIKWLRPILKEHSWNAIVDYMIYSTDEFYERVDILLDATEQYVYTSSARVYADAGNNLITEDSPRLLDVCDDNVYLQTDEYALTKARQENALIYNKRQNWTIIRPYITFSNNRLQLGVMEKEHWLIPALNNRPIVFSKDIASHLTTMTSGKTVAACIAALLTHQDAKGEVFHIVSSEAHTWQEILQWYMEAYEEVKGERPTIFYTDKWDARFGGSAYQCKYDRLFNRHFDNSKIHKIVPDVKFECMEVEIKEALKSFILNYKPSWQDLDQNIELERGILTRNFLPLKQVRGKKSIIKTIALKLHLVKS